MPNGRSELIKFGPKLFIPIDLLSVAFPITGLRVKVIDN